MRWEEDITDQFIDLSAEMNVTGLQHFALLLDFNVQNCCSLRCSLFWDVTQCWFNYQPTLHNIKEEQGLHLHCGRSLKSCSLQNLVYIQLVCLLVAPEMYTNNDETCHWRASWSATIWKAKHSKSYYKLCPLQICSSCATGKKWICPGSEK